MIKKFLLLTLGIISIYLIISKTLEESIEIYVYQHEKNLIKESVEHMELVIPDWEWKRYIKRGKIDSIDPLFGTMFGKNERNKIIAGHNINRVFHDLHYLKKGMRIELHYNNQILTYNVFDMLIVNVDEVQYLEESEKEQLTLITCTENDQKRLIIICLRVLE